MSREALLTHVVDQKNDFAFEMAFRFAKDAETKIAYGYHSEPLTAAELELKVKDLFRQRTIEDGLPELWDELSAPHFQAIRAAKDKLVELRQAKMVLLQQKINFIENGLGLSARRHMAELVALRKTCGEDSGWSQDNIANLDREALFESVKAKTAELEKCNAEIVAQEKIIADSEAKLKRAKQMVNRSLATVYGSDMRQRIVATPKLNWDAIEALQPTDIAVINAEWERISHRRHAAMLLAVEMEAQQATIQADIKTMENELNIEDLPADLKKNILIKHMNLAKFNILKTLHTKRNALNTNNPFETDKLCCNKTYLIENIPEKHYGKRKSKRKKIANIVLRSILAPAVGVGEGIVAMALFGLTGPLLPVAIMIGLMGTLVNVFLFSKECKGVIKEILFNRLDRADGEKMKGRKKGTLFTLASSAAMLGLVLGVLSYVSAHAAIPAVLGLVGVAAMNPVGLAVLAGFIALTTAVSLMFLYYQVIRKFVKSNGFEKFKGFIYKDLVKTLEGASAKEKAAKIIGHIFKMMLFALVSALTIIASTILFKNRVDTFITSTMTVTNQIITTVSAVVSWVLAGFSQIADSIVTLENISTLFRNIGRLFAHMHQSFQRDPALAWATFGLRVSQVFVRVTGVLLSLFMAMAKIGAHIGHAIRSSVGKNKALNDAKREVGSKNAHKRVAIQRHEKKVHSAPTRKLGREIFGTITAVSCLGNGVGQAAGLAKDARDQIIQFGADAVSAVCTGAVAGAGEGQISVVMNHQASQESIEEDFSGRDHTQAGSQKVVAATPASQLAKARGEWHLLGHLFKSSFKVGPAGPLSRRVSPQQAARPSEENSVLAGQVAAATV